jgi:hypothetical protein
MKHKVLSNETIFREWEDQYLLHWWTTNPYAIFTLSLHQSSWYNMMANIMCFHILNENGVVAIIWNYNFTSNCFYYLRMIRENNLLHLSHTVLALQCYRLSISQKFMTFFEHVTPLRNLGPGHYLFPVHYLNIFVVAAILLFKKLITYCVKLLLISHFQVFSVVHSLGHMMFNCLRTTEQSNSSLPSTGHCIQLNLGNFKIYDI